MDIQKQIGKNLNEARTKLKLTQSDVAKKAGINTNYYSKLERGEIGASTDTLHKLTKALHIKSSEILPF